MSIEYNELLRLPPWQRKRLEIFQRDNFTCQKCTDTLSNLQIHHKYYKAGTMPWDYPNESLVTLCELCHQKAEFIKWLYSRGNDALIRLQLSFGDRHEVLELIARRVQQNHYRQDVEDYMLAIKKQLNG